MVSPGEFIVRSVNEPTRFNLVKVKETGDILECFGSNCILKNSRSNHKAMCGHIAAVLMEFNFDYSPQINYEKNFKGRKAKPKRKNYSSISHEIVTPNQNIKAVGRKPEKNKQKIQKRGPETV